MSTITDQGMKCFRDMSYSLIQGDSVLIELDVKDGSDVVIDVSSYGCQVEVSTLNGVTPLLAFTEADASNVLLGNGTFKLALSRAESLALAHGTYTIQVRLDDLSGVVTTLTEGRFAVNRSLIQGAVTPIAVTGITGMPATLTIAVNEQIQFGVIVAPATCTDKRVTWSTSVGAKASVSSTGVVKGLVAGDTTITATSVLTPAKTETCTVTVA